MIIIVVVGYHGIAGSSSVYFFDTKALHGAFELVKSLSPKGAVPGFLFIVIIIVVVVPTGATAVMIRHFDRFKEASSEFLVWRLRLGRKKVKLKPAADPAFSLGRVI